MRPARNTIDTVLACLDRGDGCWVWPRATNAKGYGIVKVSGRVWLVHRFIYESLVCPVPDGQELDHLCRNRACANPAHQPVIHLENVQRGDCAELARARMTGRPGWNATKTHCKHGHPFNTENTRITRDGERACRVCGREGLRRRRAGAGQKSDASAALTRTFVNFLRKRSADRFGAA